jgi:hypothetical protein
MRWQALKQNITILPEPVPVQPFGSFIPNLPSHIGNHRILTGTMNLGEAALRNLCQCTKNRDLRCCVRPHPCNKKGRIAEDGIIRNCCTGRNPDITCNIPENKINPLTGKTVDDS